MDNNLRTVKRTDLKLFIRDTFISYGVCIDDIDINIYSLFIRITFERNKLDSDDVNCINNALAELFKLNVFSSDPGKIEDFCNGNFMSLLHPFNIVD